MKEHKQVNRTAARLAGTFQRPRSVLTTAAAGGLIVGVVLAAITLAPKGTPASGATSMRTDAISIAPPAQIPSSGPPQSLLATEAGRPSDHRPDEKIQKTSPPARTAASAESTDRADSARPTSPGQPDSSPSASSSWQGRTPTPPPTKSARAKVASETKTKAPVADTYLIKNEITGMCVDAAGYGAVSASTRVTQFRCVSGTGDNQMFRLLWAGSEFQIYNEKSKLCVDVPDYGAKPAGTLLKLFTCHPGSTDNQMWRRQAQGDGYFLINVKSNLCLDVSNTPPGRMTANQQLTLYPCSAQDDHIWSFH